ncbi:MAG TPA: hypothetical protein VFF27_00185 [Bacteroidia bacterium]|jgi:hypothetical protein|nr:hypothetical protein [Bacteroidia bacterium]
MEACYPEFEAIENKVCSPFFENSVIIDLINKKEHINHDYFGVFSGHFKNKMTHSRDMKKLTPDYILERLDTDVVSFFRNHKNSNVINKAEVFHPGFKRAIYNILEAVGFQVDIEKDTRFTVYQNHFITTSQIYDRYVKELLEPAVKEMCNKDNKELQNIIWQDSGYHKKKTMPEKLKQELGVNYYPYHTFLCERLFSIFLNRYTEITCKHL